MKEVGEGVCEGVVRGRRPERRIPNGILGEWTS